MQVAHVFVEVAQSLFQPLHIRLLDTVETDSSVHFQSLCSSHNHSQTWLDAAFTAFDVIEFLCSEISTETGFRHYVISEGHCHFCSKYGVASVCDIRKRAAMHEGCRIFRCLHQIGMDGIFQQHGYGTGHTEVFYRKRLTVISESEEDVFDASAEVFHVTGQTKDSHDFRSGSDVESRLHGDAVRLGSQSGDNVTQRTVVHIENPAPKNFFQSETVCLILIQVIVEQRGNHVVCRGDRVKITRKMEVDLIHRKHLCISSSGSSPLHPEARA